MAPARGNNPNDTTVRIRRHDDRRRGWSDCLTFFMKTMSVTLFGRMGVVLLGPATQIPKEMRYATGDCREQSAG